MTNGWSAAVIRYLKQFSIVWVAAAVTLGLAVSVLLQLPFANGPSEWEWAYRPPGLAGWVPAALTAVALVGLAVWAGRREPPAWAPAVVAVLACLFTLALVRSQPGGFERVAASLASRNSFGFLYDAALAPPAGELLADFPAATRRLNQHARTHPPGALLAVRAMDALGRRLEAVAPVREGGFLAAARDALERERQRARERRRPAPVELPSPWTVALLAFLLPALSAAAALPLAALARVLGLARGTALAAAVLWALVPARSLFTPSLDQALPVLVVLAALLAAGGRTRWAGRACWLAAGLCLGVACLVSYGYLVGVPLVAALALAGGPAERNEAGVGQRDDDPRTPPAAGRELAAGSSWRSLARQAGTWRWRALLWLAAGFAAPWATLALAAGYDPFASFTAAMAMHGVIAVANRSYLTWILWNPYDFVLLLGPPVALLALAWPAVRRRSNPPATDRLPRPLAVPFAALWGTLAVLWLAGGVRGEVGRIWLLFMPFACLFAAAALAPSEEAGEAPRPGPLIAVAALQAVLTFALAASMVFVS